MEFSFDSLKKTVLMQEVDETPKLTKQFFVTLKATFDQVKKNNKNADPEIVEKIQKLFDSGYKGWHKAYEIERLLIDIYDEETLKLELKKCVVEAKPVLSEDDNKFYETEFQVADPIPEQRSLLNRLINDLQWRYTITECQRYFSRSLRKRTGIAFVGSIALFLLVVIFLNKLENFSADVSNGLIAMTAGFFGACFSMLVSIKKRLSEVSFDDLKVLSKWPPIMTRAIIGPGAALIIFYMLQAELLTGSMFPDFNQPDVKKHKTSELIYEYLIFDFPDSIKTDKAAMNQPKELLEKSVYDIFTKARPGAKDTLFTKCKNFVSQISDNKLTTEKTKELATSLTTKLWILAGFTPLLDSKNLALLIFWCFLAGFSEQFVPNLLAKAESKADVK